MLSSLNIDIFRIIKNSFQILYLSVSFKQNNVFVERMPLAETEFIKI